MVSKPAKLLSKRVSSERASPVLMTHQIEALELAYNRLKNNRAVYLALDPGLGKTICAAVIASKVTSGRMVFVTRSGLRSTAAAEFGIWAPGKTVEFVSNASLKELSLQTIEVLFIDEAQDFANPKSQRTAALFRLAKKAKKVVLMSGTPAPNSRPIELWPILSEFAPDVFGDNFFEYGKKYCGAEQVKTGWDREKRRPIMRWKFDGYTARQEFKARLYKSFMIRMKKDRIKLPEKREAILTVGDGMPAVVSKLEQKVLDLYTKSDETEEWLTGLAGETKLHLMNYLKRLGEYKVSYVLPHIDRILLDSNENLLIFAMHKEVVSELEKHLAQWKPIVITGETPVKKRASLVEEFQTNPKRRVAILNLIAGGIGWTLTKADRVLLVEYSWRDGDNSQASDRAHRIGRDRPVLVQYVVLKDSVDARRMTVLLNKRQHAL